MKKYKTACFGGTFDIPLHKGHEALIRKAFEVADFCCIGLTGDEYLARKGKTGAKSFEERKKHLMKCLGSMRVARRRYAITMLENFFGPELLDPKRGIEAIVVSGKTLAGANGINIIREDFGLKPLEIIQVGTVKAKDGKPISSGRIRSGEITPEGSLAFGHESLK